MRTGVVGKAERAHDELAGLYALYSAADFQDHAAVLVPHMHGFRYRIRATIGPQIGTADASGRQANDRVSRMDDFGFGYILAAYVARPVKNGSQHGIVSFRYLPV